jgi:two-component system, NarL family, nitrate/nitrite response regulator NarL
MGATNIKPSPALQGAKVPRRHADKLWRMANIRIFISDDHTLFRDALRQLLESQLHFKVIGEASSGQETLQQARILKPDVLLLDVRLPNLSGLDVLRQFDRSPATRVIFLTANVDISQVAQALHDGARGVVLKDASSEAIFDSIRAVIAGQYWIFNHAVPSLEHALERLAEGESAGKSHMRRFDLTPREYEVMRAIASGRTNKEIASFLGISEQTIKHHVTNIFNKTGVSNRLELILLAIQNKLIDVESRSARTRN